MIYYILIPVGLVVLLLLFRRQTFSERKYSFSGRSLESELRAAEGANMVLASELRKAERELDNLKKNTVSLAEYQDLQKQCILLEKFIKKYIETKL